MPVVQTAVGNTFSAPLAAVNRSTVRGLVDRSVADRFLVGDVTGEAEPLEALPHLSS